jgi:hypothetical protein
MNITPNAIYQADCLELLGRIASETVTLVYIDPPNYSAEVEPSEDSDGGKFKEGFKQHLVLLSQVFQQSHRILSKSGNLFFHAEPMLAGSARLILDQVFGRENYRVEFTWLHRSHSIPSTTPRAWHDVILLYSWTSAHYDNYWQSSTVIWIT